MISKKKMELFLLSELKKLTSATAYRHVLEVLDRVRQARPRLPEARLLPHVLEVCVHLVDHPEAMRLFLMYLEETSPALRDALDENKVPD